MNNALSGSHELSRPGTKELNQEFQEAWFTPPAHMRAKLRGEKMTWRTHLVRIVCLFVGMNVIIAIIFGSMMLTISALLIIEIDDIEEPAVCNCPHNEDFSGAPTSDWTSGVPTNDWTSGVPTNDWTSGAPKSNWTGRAPKSNWTGRAPEKQLDRWSSKKRLDQ